MFCACNACIIWEQVYHFVERAYPFVLGWVTMNCRYYITPMVVLPSPNRERKRGHTNRHMHIHRQTIRNIMDKLSAKDCRCDSLSLSKICKEFVTEKYISTSFLLFLSSMWKLVVAIAPLISNSSSSSSTFLIANKLVRRWRYQPTDRKRLCLTDY